jgi:hypothetical protein
MSAEEMHQLKKLMGRNFKDIVIPAPEDALPYASGGGRHGGHYDTDEDYMKRKLKGI